MTKLYYFTNSFPYGMGEEWKLQELEILKDYFSKIIVIPYTHGGNKTPRSLSSSIEVLQPLFNVEISEFRFRDIFSQILRFPLVCLSELWRNGLIFNLKKLKKALFFLSASKRILRHPSFVELLNRSDENTYWFFYWGRGIADALPFLPSFKRKKIAVRLHRYDIFEYANGGYIPFRKAFYKGVDILFSVSEYGRKYLTDRYPEYTNKVLLARLGTKSKGRSVYERKDYFNLVSCSNVVSVKRLDLILRALSIIKSTRIRWTHIGDGPLFEQIKEQSNRLPTNIEIKFQGRMHPSKVLDYLVGNPVDLFINVSSSEGVPVSIMEALSAGIPVLATNAGGTSELVDDSLGKLVEVEIDPEELSKIIVDFASLDETSLIRLRDNAYEKYEQLCDADKCTKTFTDLLL